MVNPVSYLPLSNKLPLQLELFCVEIKNYIFDQGSKVHLSNTPLFAKSHVWKKIIWSAQKCWIKINWNSRHKIFTHSIKKSIIQYKVKYASILFLKHQGTSKIKRWNRKRRWYLIKTFIHDLCKPKILFKINCSYLHVCTLKLSSKLNFKVVMLSLAFISFTCIFEDNKDLQLSSYGHIISEWLYQSVLGWHHTNRENENYWRTKPYQIQTLSMVETIHGIEKPME